MTTYNADQFLNGSISGFQAGVDHLLFGSGSAAQLVFDTTGVDLAPLRAPGVEFAGYVDDIQSVVAERAAVVVPLLSGGGTRLKVLEAFALETPVVGTSKGVEGLGVVDGVHARVADAPETFAEAVIDVFTHPDLAQARAARARQEIADPAAWPLVLAGLDAAIETARERWARRQRS